MSLFDTGPPDVAEFTLPWPPTVNHYWVQQYSPKHKRVFVFVGTEGKHYQQNVIAEVWSKGPPPKLKGHLKLECVLHPPTKARMDLDNRLKGLLDAMQEAGVYDDDSQIQHIDIRFGPPVKDGKAYVRLTTMGI